MRTIKEECIWISDFDTFQEAKETIGKWIKFNYNKFYIHSSLGYLSPGEFERSFENTTTKVVA